MQQNTPIDVKPINKDKNKELLAGNFVPLRNYSIRICYCLYCPT